MASFRRDDNTVDSRGIGIFGIVLISVLSERLWPSKPDFRADLKKRCKSLIY